MTKGIWIYLEQNKGIFESVALELATKGRELSRASGEKLQGFILGSKVAALSEEALEYGFDEVFVVDDPLLESYRTDPYTEAATQVLQKYQPNILLMGATANGRDLAGRLAVRFKTGLTADCTDLQVKKENNETLLVGEVTGFGGGIAALILCPKKRPQMATVRPGIFKALKSQETSHGKVTRVEASIDSKKIRTAIVETHQEELAYDVTKAKQLVVAGRGTKGDFSLLRELAQLLEAQIGVTRVAVDEGWASRELQIGQTGYASRPKVAIVCGASGASQFTVGLAEAGSIVAINTDREAPIFESADYCIVGDIFKVLPALIEEVKKTKILQPQ